MTMIPAIMVATAVLETTAIMEMNMIMHRTVTRFMATVKAIVIQTKTRADVIQEWAGKAAGCQIMIPITIIQTNTIQDPIAMDIKASVDMDSGDTDH